MATSTSGTITAAAQTITLSALADPVLFVEVSGTYAGVELVFEASTDSGSTFFPYAMKSWAEVQKELNQTNLLTNATRTYENSRIASITDFRIRSLSHTSGTMDVTIRNDIIPIFSGVSPLPVEIVTTQNVDVEGNPHICKGAVSRKGW